MEATKEQNDNDSKKKLFHSKKMKARKASTVIENEKNEFNNEIIKIGEKVKFWEEQERLNRELIPRVIKNNEHIKSLTSRLSVVSNDIQETKILVLNVINKDIEILKGELKYNADKVELLNQKIGEYEDKLAELNSDDFLIQIKNNASEMEDMKIEYSKKFDNYEKNLMNMEKQITSIFTNHNKLQYITIIISFVAIILALGSIILD